MYNANNFDWQFYVTNYEDLRKNGINTKEKAYRHWIKFGEKEGRTCIQNKLIKLYPEINDYVIKNKLQDRVFRIGAAPYDIYNEIICACDIGIQIRPGNSGGLSGSVTDCLSVDLPVITVQDIVSALDINHKMLIGFDLLQYNDWISFKEPKGGHSNKLIADIVNVLINFIKNNKTINHNDEKISEIINNRTANYPQELIKILCLKQNDKIAFVTPYPPDNSGVADFTHSTINDLSKYIKHIDIFTDSNITGTNIFKIDEIQSKFNNYVNVIYVVGNSPFHTKIIMYLQKLGGSCILHDERLAPLYFSLGKVPPNFVLDEEKGHTSLCLHEIIHANPLIVHSKKLQIIIKTIYNKDAAYIPFCSFNKLKKYNQSELKLIRMKYKMDGNINIVANGRFALIKCPFLLLKIAEHLRIKGIKCNIYFVGP